MITLSTNLDLGHDRSRIRDLHDKHRQEETVKVLLERFFADTAASRSPLQVVADEVGMGKTFVALATAYSVLEAMRAGKLADPDLAGCYQRVLVVTPQNEALFTKWQNETGEFVKRCVVGDGDKARKWFAPVPVRRIDDLSAALRRSGQQPQVLVTTMGLFARTSLENYDLKRRLLLGALFRHWGHRFSNSQRESVLKGAPEGWPSTPQSMFDFTGRESERLAFTPDEVRQALANLEKQRDAAELMATALQACRQIAVPYTRGRDELFKGLGHVLTKLYKRLSASLIARDFPLVIVDEAHNWKNGPTKDANGYKQFCSTIACRSRRILLLTATPFQLRPEEMIEILKLSDAMAPCPSTNASQVMLDAAKARREQVLQKVLERSAAASKVFARNWSALPRRGTTEILRQMWALPEIQTARRQLDEAAEQAGAAPEDMVMRVASTAVSHVDPEWRPFLRDALRLHAYNADLSAELGAVMVRHRRNTGHRWVRVGEEFRSEAPPDRPDAHILHGARGIDVRGEGELAHYLLMRCVSELKRSMGKVGRSSLGSDLTGCYTTLQASAEGKQIKSLLARSPLGARYLKLLNSMVNASSDAQHPKVVPVVDHAVGNWRRGEKTLIFCFRVNTAERLADIIEQRIRREMRAQERRCLGGEGSLDALKKRLTARTSGLFNVALDRVLWSLVAAERMSPDSPAPLRPADLLLTEEDVHELARVSLIFRTSIHGEHVDRVFLARATEHVLALRLVRRDCSLRVKAALKQIADEKWIMFPYGLRGGPDDSGEGEQPAFDERGVHAQYPIEYPDPAGADVADLARRLLDTRRKARQSGDIPVLDAYAEGPNLWTGGRPQTDWSEERPATATLQRHLWALTASIEPDAYACWESRRRVMAALRRAVLRHSVLVRLLPTRAERTENTWDALLVNAFIRPQRDDQGESLVDRATVFLEDLEAAGGDLAAENPAQRGLRGAICDSMRLTDQFVALVKGGGGGEQERRTRIFTGFNTPLLPEVLVCTQVGQEGIDLHRHCRHVVHYDLAWNPAVMEQRTGRTDRIGSKAFREIERAAGTDRKPKLEVGVPYLAATYDERMYEELRLRAQAFEVLTGGDFSADNPEGQDDQPGAQGQELGSRLVPLPEEMIADLRVRLNVYPRSI